MIRGQDESCWCNESEVPRTLSTGMGLSPRVTDESSTIIPEFRDS